MEFSVKSGSPEKQRSACIVVGVFEPRRLSPIAEQLDKISDGYISALLRRGELEGKPGQTLLLHHVPNVLSERILLIGCGKERELDERQYKQVIQKTINTLNDTGSMEAVCFLTELHVKGRNTYWKVRQAVETAKESLYSFDQLKTNKSEPRRPLRKMVFNVPTRRELTSGERAIQHGLAIAAGIKAAKDLGNMPPNICNAAYLASQARQLADAYSKNVYRLMILLPFLIALLPITGRTLRSHLGWWTKIIILGVIISGIYVGISGILTYSKLEKAYNKHERISQELYNDIKYDLTLLNHYYNSIANKLPACEEFYLLKEYVELYPSSYGLCELGRRYKSRKLFSQAKECFIFAYHINPSLIVPQYELFLLYREEKNMNQMVAIGERILHQPVKQENTISIKIKTEVRKILRDHLTKNMVTK